MGKVIRTHFAFRTKKNNYHNVIHIKMTFLTMESPQSFQLTTNFKLFTNKCFNAIEIFVAKKVNVFVFMIIFHAKIMVLRIFYFKILSE